MSNLHLEIISPNGVLFKGECHLAVVPSISGDIGFMQGHELVIAAMRQGEVAVYDDKQNLVKSFEVSSGFAEMKDINNLLVLVD